MANVILHIEYLLHRHDCVIIPSIGAFIKSSRSAQIKDGIFYPPYKEICFNSSIINNDGLLVNSVARKEKLTYEQALSKVNNEILCLRESLANDEELSIGRLGTLLLDKDGNISFSPRISALGMAQANGFSQISVANTGIANIGRNNIDSDSSRKFRTDKNYYIPINKRFAKYAAILFFALIGAFTLSLPTRYSGSVVIDQASILPVNKISTSAKTSAHKATNVKTTKHTKAQTQDAQTHTIAQKHYLVVATFKSENDCRKFISSTPSGSYDLKIASTPTVSRVYAECSTDKDSLAETLNSQEFKDTFKYGGWIWSE